MASPQRLVLFVEGEADASAVPVLVKHFLTEMQAWEHVFLDPKPFLVGNVAEVARDDGKPWRRFLQDARKRRNLGGVLLLQDGDLRRIRGEDFCAWRFAHRLAQWARPEGAGILFSVAVVFALREYESWLIACVDRLAGLALPDGRPGIRLGTRAPAGNVEEAPRDAKGWLNDCMESGYKNTRDQEALTRLMVDHLDAILVRNIRSFRRLETALRQIVEGIRSRSHLATPANGPPRS
jgi:hypothetical protein